MILLSGSESWQINSTKVEVQQEARKAGDWIKQELIQSGASTITNVPANGTWYTTITFKTAIGTSGGSISWSANTIQYSIVAAGTGRRLVRTSGGTTRVLAVSMQSLQFRRQAATPNVVEVNLQARKLTPKGTTLTNNSNFKVKMRN